MFPVTLDPVYTVYTIGVFLGLYLEFLLGIYGLYMYTSSLGVLGALGALGVWMFLRWIPWPHSTCPCLSLGLARTFERIYDTTVSSEFRPPPGNRRVIYAAHPHSVFPTQSFHYLANSIPLAVAPNMLHSLMARLLGFVSAQRASFVQTLEERGSVVLFPGGADEMLLHSTSRPGTLELYLHTGVFRLAREQNALLVPSLCVDDVHRFRTSSRLNSLGRLLWRSIRLPLCANAGMYGIPFIPIVSRHHRTTILQSLHGLDANQFPTVDALIAAYKHEIHTMASSSGIQVSWNSTVK